MLRTITLSSIAVLALSISACASVQKVSGDKGQTDYKIGCLGADDWGDCYLKAADLCGDRGYSVLSKDGDPSPSSVFAVWTSRSITVACKVPYSPSH